MSRITKVEKDAAPDDVRALYESIGSERGKVPNMFRVFAHRPEIMKTMIAHLEAVTNSGTVPRRTKELVATLVSRINDCHYCDRSHTAQAGRHGATPAQLEELLGFELGPFSDSEKAALAYAHRLTVDARAVDDALFDRLRAHYDEGEIVELSAMAGLFNYFNRVNNALQMEPTKAGEGL